VLTTTVDGLWALQVLAGIETLAPELGLRPILPSAEPKQLALDHPVAAELRAAGVIDETGEVDSVIVEWLTVLSRRDVSLVMHVRTPADDGLVRVLLARFAQWWVVMERSEDIVRISAAGTASAEGAANTVLIAQIERLCGSLPPASLRPVTLDVDTLTERVSSTETLRVYLADQRLDADQLHILMLAVDATKSAQASIVAIQSGAAPAAAGRAYIEQSVVTVIDTREGRLVAEHVPRSGKRWMIIAPGTPGNIASAINHMVRRLPANDEWFSYRKVV
jgi:EspG family